MFKYISFILSLLISSILFSKEPSEFGEDLSNSGQLALGNCDKRNLAGWSAFLNLKWGEGQKKVKKELGKHSSIDYQEDSLIHIYNFNDVAMSPISIWVNTKKDKIETVFMEVLSYPENFQSTLRKTEEVYKLSSCDTEFFGMTGDEVIEAMGKPRADSVSVQNIRHISYDNLGDVSVLFKFFPAQGNLCSSIEVNWYY